MKRYCVPVLIISTACCAFAQSYDFNDSHLHLTNYVQEGTDIYHFLKIMGNRAGRVALFGIPLQQQWSFRSDGDDAPTYYLGSDAPLYYYSFTDAWIARAYLSLTASERARFDPMITGFNPSDMYAADHIRRVLQTFPGVFSGIGEFTIHKEFVSSKVAGEVASLLDPALDRILDFAAEAGLLVILHNDIDVPFAKEGAPPAYLDQMRDLFKRHPQTTIIWAHTGVGRVVRPIRNHLANLEVIIRESSNVNFDLSWDEVAKYIIASPEATALTAGLINRYPDRFLFGTDEVAPPDQAQYLRVFNLYDPLWKLLTPEASRKVRLENYQRLFDAARVKVRAWEKAHPAGASRQARDLEDRSSHLP
ncbi:MAG: amidohydrolase family protein [Bryobacterales bacterium]|nr:amidohydrolase family protein [Bryobacterales bacterium]MBV9401800.1 amidohydrolase family protein [Bryobacterales bacterium]